MNSTRRMFGVLAMVLAVVAITACGSSDESSGPPEIVEGRTVCDECGMIIDEIRFAASYRSIDGVERRFDDIGGMLAQGHRDGLLADSEIWVHDFESHEPLPARDASFVLSGQVVTPMAWGVVAFASTEDAHELAADVDGTVVSWTELVERSEGDDLDPEQLHHEHEAANVMDSDMTDSDNMDSDEGEG